VGRLGTSLANARKKGGVGRGEAVEADEVVAQLVVDRATTVESQDTCLVTARNSTKVVRSDQVAEVAVARASTAARRVTCLVSALIRRRIAGRVPHAGVMTESATTAVVVDICHVTVRRRHVVLATNATSAVALTIFSAIVRRTLELNVELGIRRRLCAATTAMSWVTSRGIAPLKPELPVRRMAAARYHAVSQVRCGMST